MTTETLHTVIQYKYKHYEKWVCFLLIFIQNVRGASATRSLFFLLLDMRFRYLRWILTITVLLFFTTVSWYWRTLETFGTGLMHNINKRKQTSQWFTNQTEDIIISYDLTYSIPAPMHYTMSWIFIYYIYATFSYFLFHWYKGKHISMQSVSCSAFLYI